MAGDWHHLFKGIRTRSVSLAAGETLFAVGEEARSLFHVERGRILVSRHGVTLHRAEAGELLAEASLFAPVFDCDAVADIPSRVEIFPKAAVLLHLSAHPQINLAFSAALARQVQALRGRLEITRLKSARERVVVWLIQGGAMDSTIRLDRPLLAVAAELGLTHEALYRTLARLVADGRLERPGQGLFRLVQHGQ
ncbi:Crp/Fnr family transcriptional regulator [Paramagnetospirillum kuznetsovii]|uniref:Crp/Fnr family transcriptional regulator n=1 Tax=Paramagnetospirillum kuznetsovii TaxID=2053833 RepID=A0A364P2X4_9PROT|nr:Crp/Fnr family transcriptional regulator [Paramagnetospirillum kuznetsovii]RAU23699.1 Crp/Fnr family transcriptional regulator [Paramagnetospirillum kuznetsovii]